MKKFLVLVVVLIVTACTYSIATTNIGGRMDAEYAVFTKGQASSDGIWLYGDTYMTQCSKRQLSKRSTFNNIIGYQATFNGDYDEMLKEIKRQKIAVLSDERLDGVYIIYGISDNFGKSVNVGDAQVNVQIALRGNRITVGTPLIMGSY